MAACGAGIDVSLERSSVCVVDALGKIVKEAKISSEPAALVAFFEALSARVALKAEYEKLHKTVLAIVRDDALCRRLMTVSSASDILFSRLVLPRREAEQRPCGLRLRDAIGIIHRRFVGYCNHWTDAGSRGRAMRWCARRSMKPPMF